MEYNVVMDARDWLLPPVYLFGIYLFAFIYRNRFYPKGSSYRRYFISALSAKIGGSVAISIIYLYYYGKGDTFNYYDNSLVLYNAFFEDPVTAIKIFFADAGDYTVDKGVYTSRMFFFHAASSMFVIRLSAFLGLFCFHNYLVIAILFSLFSFIGLWKMYQTFHEIFPNMGQKLAIAVLFMPSVIFWSSGLLKDGITIGALGWAFFCFYRVFIKKQTKPILLIALIISLYILIQVKIYILICFIPSAFFWVFMEYNAKIKAQSIKIIFRPVFILAGILAGYFITQQLAAENSKYEFDNLLETANVTANYILRTSDDAGATYTLSDQFDGTLLNFLKLAPEAAIVTLFRPFLWESDNIVMLIASLEGTFFLFFTIFTLYIYFVFRKKNPILKENKPILIFCLIFSLSFAVAVGASSYNFGALVRYKIPMIPFYMVALYILRNK